MDCSNIYHNNLQLAITQAEKYISGVWISIGVFHTYSVMCVCGRTFVAEMEDSVNAERTPDLRAKIKQGDMHRFTCPNCQRKMTIENEFLYSDFGRNTIIKVMLRKERYRWREASKLLEKDTKSTL